MNKRSILSLTCVAATLHMASHPFHLISPHFVCEVAAPVQSFGSSRMHDPLGRRIRAIKLMQGCHCRTPCAGSVRFRHLKLLICKAWL